MDLAYRVMRRVYEAGINGITLREIGAREGAQGRELARRFLRNENYLTKLYPSGRVMVLTKRGRQLLMSLDLLHVELNG